MRSPWLVTVHSLLFSMFVAGLLFSCATPTSFAQELTEEEQIAMEEEEEESGGYTPSGASVTAVVPETPFNTRNSLLAKLSYPMPPPLTPEQQALVISGMGAISITLFACYVFNLGAHS